MPRHLIVVRAPGQVHGAVDKSKARTLIFVERIKRKERAITAIATTGDGDRRGEFDRAVRSLAAVDETECVEALVTVPGTSRVCAYRFCLRDDVQRFCERVCAYRFCLRDDVQRFCERIDHWRSDDADIRLNVLASHVRGGGPGLSGGHKSLGPIHHARIRVGVKGVHGIVRSGGENHIVRTACDGKIADPEGLRINRGVHGTGKQLCERGGVDVGRSKRKFLRVDTGARGFVVVGGHTGEVGNADGGGIGFAGVEGTGGCDYVHAGTTWRVVEGGTRSDIGEGAG